jgi:RNA polymerase sigma-70 factor (ECF subfamily)
VADAEILFAEHRQGVFRYLWRVVGQAETARDLTQEVFLRVSRSPVPRADAAGRRAWVFKIARNLVLNHLRDQRRGGEAVGLTDASAPAVQELAVAISEALARLEPLDRDVFLLRETAGLSYVEVAAACELTVEAVRGRLRRARQHLRASLDGEIRVRRERPVNLSGTDRERDDPGSRGDN